MASPRETIVRELVEHVDGEGPPLVVTGGRGAGKSTLCDGIASALGRGMRSCVIKLVEQGGRSCHDLSMIEDVEREGAKLLRNRGLAFRVLRSRRAYDGPTLPYFDVQGGRIYLLIDGLDHIISSRRIDGSFLPITVPPGTRLVVSVSQGPIVDALAARGWRVHEVAPLDEEERRRVIAPLLRRHERRAELNQALLAWPHGGHPTRLRIAAALAAATNKAPTAGDDIAAVVRRLLDHRQPDAKQTALLALAEHGVPHFSWGPVSRNVDLASFEPLVVDRCGMLQPALPEVRAALRARCTEDDLRRGHLAVFEEYADRSPYGLYELAAEHLLAYGDPQRMAGFITRMEPFQIITGTDIWLTTRCWRAANMADDPSSCDRMLESTLPARSRELRIAIINNTGLLAEKMGWKEVALRLKRRTLNEAKQAFPLTHAKVGTALFNLAAYLGETRDNDAEAERTYLELLAIYDGLTSVDEQFPAQWYVLDYYARFLGVRARYDESLARREEAIAAVRKAMGERHPRTARELLDTSDSIRWQAPDRALAYAESAYAILCTAFGPLSTEATAALRAIAASHLALGQPVHALTASRRALEAGLAMVAKHPHEAGYALGQMVNLAEAEGDRRAAFAYQQRQYDHYRNALGPDHPTTLSVAERVARLHETAGELEQALAVHLLRCERYLATKGPGNVDLLGAQTAAARVSWRLGRRIEAERRLDEWTEAIEACSSIGVKGMARMLRAEWAREDGQGDAQRALLEQALALYEEAPASARAGIFHVLLAGNLFLAGDREASERHHEAGLVPLDDSQLHLAFLVLRPYEDDTQLAAEDYREAQHRRRGLCALLATSTHRPRLDRALLGERPLRAAWNPGDGRTFAVLDEAGRTCLCHWHPEAGQIERLDLAFPQVDLPKDRTAIGLRWSASGQALRLRTPEREEVLGCVADGVAWAPASPVSPDGRYALVSEYRALGLVHAPGWLPPASRKRQHG
ncbi:MAG: tetratricopeptide repeat protein [Deltaproteobacteria bacterium]|nr:tetratricopeptide repeat protein [Deltaproteobacteria bacterium]